MKVSCKDFAITGKREMCLKNLTSCLELPLGIGTMFDIFQSVGTFPGAIGRLKREATDVAISSAKIFSIHKEPSGPDAEWSLIEVI